MRRFWHGQDRTEEGGGGGGGGGGVRENVIFFYFERGILNKNIVG